MILSMRARQAASSARRQIGNGSASFAHSVTFMAGFPGHEACVQARARSELLVHAGADEHDFLAAIAIDVVPVLTQPLPPERIIRPSFRRHALAHHAPRAWVRVIEPA